MSKDLRVESSEEFLFVAGNVANCSLSLFVFSVYMVGYKGNSKSVGGHTPRGSPDLHTLTKENRDDYFALDFAKSKQGVKGWR